MKMQDVMPLAKRAIVIDVRKTRFNSFKVFNPPFIINPEHELIGTIVDNGFCRVEDTEAPIRYGFSWADIQEDVVEIDLSHGLR